jgi:hypothetical protein
MSSVVNDPNAPHHRRSREEVEALAKNFVATPANDDAVPAKPKTLMMAAAAGAVVVVGLVAWIAWPSSETTRTANSQEQSRASAEVEELRQRMEAERERQRKELEAGKEYMERIAAADAAQIKDLAAQVDRLTERVAQVSAAVPSSASDPAPTPREESRTAAAPAKSAPATASASQAPATTTAAAPQKSAPAPAQQPKQEQAAPAQAEPTQVAQAAPSDCKIHVSELSSSGKLTYESIKKMKGARLNEANGHVFTPPVPAAGGRMVTFEVMPDGCVNVVRR